MADKIDLLGGGEEVDKKDHDDDDDSLKAMFSSYLSPYEPLIMTVQSLLVWEVPWKSAVMFTFVHILFLFICTTSSRFFFLLSLCVMTAVFIDTWKNKIWPEIRVPPKGFEEDDEWTPMHPRLLSVPELSRSMSHSWQSVTKAWRWLRRSRVSHPLVFCLGNTTFFTLTAMIGYYTSGLMLSYIIIMFLMLWPSIAYNALLRKAYIRLEPTLEWLNEHFKSKAQSVITVGGRIDWPSRMSTNKRSTQKEREEEDFIPEDGMESILAGGPDLNADCEDVEDMNNSAMETPRLSLSKAPSLNNMLDDESLDDQDFDLNLDQMPSFDDLDNTDDDLDLSDMHVTRSKARPKRRGRKALEFTSRHFGEEGSDPEGDEHGLDFSSAEATSARSSQQPHSGGGLMEAVLSGGGGGASSTQSAAQALTGHLVAQTISGMMESAIHGMATGLGGHQGHTASSSGLISKTGAKITYTRSEEGESIDFQNGAPMLVEESEEEEESDEDYGRRQSREARSEQIAEIENSFDFLEDLDPDANNSGTY